MGSIGWHCPELRAIGNGLSEGRILDLELVAEPPSGASAPATLPIVASMIVTDWEAQGIEAVRVYAASNAITKAINQIALHAPHAMGPGDNLSWRDLFGHSVGNG